jgi:predicted RNase H-like HicB family nuclease
METESRRSLADYLAYEYPVQILADPDGGYVAVFPDLPGCITQGESLAEVAAMADDARRGWIETEYDRGAVIPLPSYPEEYSGQFRLRVPKSLHRQLAESAEREGVSLNQYLVMLLARGEAEARAIRSQTLPALDCWSAFVTHILLSFGSSSHWTAPSPRRRMPPRTPAASS